MFKFFENYFCKKIIFYLLVHFLTIFWKNIFILIIFFFFIKLIVRSIYESSHIGLRLWTTNESPWFSRILGKCVDRCYRTVPAVDFARTRFKHPFSAPNDVQHRFSKTMTVYRLTRDRFCYFCRYKFCTIDLYRWIRRVSDNDIHSFTSREMRLLNKKKKCFINYVRKQIRGWQTNGGF